MSNSAISINSARWRRRRPWFISVLTWGIGAGVASAAAFHRTETPWSAVFSAGMFWGMLFGVAVALAAYLYGGAWVGAYLGGGVAAAVGLWLFSHSTSGGWWHPLFALCFMPVGSLMGARIEAISRGFPFHRGETAPVAWLSTLFGVVLWFGAIPSFFLQTHCGGGQARYCRKVLRDIADAKQRWAVDYRRLQTDVPTDADLIPTYIKITPGCPSGGTYSYGALRTKPVCTFVSTDSDHALPP